MTKSKTLRRYRVLAMGGAKASTHGDLNKPEPEVGIRTFEPAG